MARLEQAMERDRQERSQRLVALEQQNYLT